jgi:hypothetical protein
VANNALQTNGLYRNNANANYPYEIASAINIISSSANTNPYDYYYFFYNIEVEILCDGISTTLNNMSTDKNLARVIDFLGREIKVNKNEPLFYMYDDGTIGKKIILE